MSDINKSYSQIGKEAEEDINTFESLKESLPPCKNEDGDDCFWDATKRGNGKGKSFVSKKTANGVTVYYEDGSKREF